MTQDNASARAEKMAEALDEIAEKSPHQTRGEWLENLTVACAPLIADWDVSEAWLWLKWPDRLNHYEQTGDIGIDVVAKRRSDGKLIAIQSKSRKLDEMGKGSGVPKSELDSFISTSSPDIWVERWVIVNGAVRLGGNAEKTLGRDPAKPIKQVNIESDLRKQLEADRAESGAEEFSSRHRMQQEAIEKSVASLREHARANESGRARGRIILPCGTGKSRIALRIIEELAEPGQISAVLCPSIALVAQLRAEFLAHRRKDLNAMAVCSDKDVTRDRQLADDPTTDVGPSEEAEVKGLVTTDAEEIGKWMDDVSAEGKRIGVIFGTYQSSCRIADALRGGREIQVMIADEAHRTAGIRPIKKLEEKLRDFTVCHDDTRFPAKYRVYQTATPKVYSADGTKRKLKNDNWVVRDMADESVFGPELYRQSYAAAVENGWLTDYRIICIGVNDKDAYRTANKLAGKKSSKLSAAHFLKGLALALVMGGSLRRNGTEIRSSINFMNKIAHSKEMTEALQSRQVRQWIKRRLAAEVAEYLLEHLDASNRVTQRDNAKARLMGATEDNPHGILNVGIFGEGVDAPSLSAVGFLEPRKSPVDVIQAVGRVMRRAPEKELGYIICPILIPPGVDAETWLRNSGPEDGWKELGQILLALRAHDSRIEDELSELMELYLPPPPKEAVATMVSFVDDDGRVRHGVHTGKPGEAETAVESVLTGKAEAGQVFRPLPTGAPKETGADGGSGTAIDVDDRGEADKSVGQTQTGEVALGRGADSSSADRAEETEAGGETATSADRTKDADDRRKADDTVVQVSVRRSRPPPRSESADMPLKGGDEVGGDADTPETVTAESAGEDAEDTFEQPQTGEDGSGQESGSQGEDIFDETAGGGEDETPAAEQCPERIVSGKRHPDGKVEIREGRTARLKPQPDGTPGGFDAERSKKRGQKMLNGEEGVKIDRRKGKRQTQKDEHIVELFDQVKDVGISVNLLSRSGLAGDRAKRDVNILEDCVMEAKRCLQEDELDGLLDRHFGLDKLTEDKKKQQADGCTIASLLLMNAAMLHQRIAAGGWLPGISGLDNIKNATNAVAGCYSQWNRITRYDFLPVIEPAIDIIEAVQRHGRLTGLNRALRHLAGEAERIAESYADLGADHAGPLFNRVMGNQASDGAFFTRPPAAALLARLTLDAVCGDADWTADATWKDCRTVDLACGSGTLIAAVLTDMKRRAREQGAGRQRLADLQKLAVEQVIAGLDFNPVSLQLAAAQLTVGNSDTAYRKMGLHRMPYGPGEGGARAGTLELLGQKSLIRSAGFELPDESLDSEALRLGHDDPLLDDAVDAVKGVRIVVMNPPFTNRSKMGEKFAPEVQKEMRGRVDGYERSLVAVDPAMDGFADKNSITPLFVALADKCVDPTDGALAMIHPTIALTAISGRHERVMLAKRFHVHTLLTCHRPGLANLSQNTSINESMIILKRHAGGGLRHGSSASTASRRTRARRRNCTGISKHAMRDCCRTAGAKSRNGRPNASRQGTGRPWYGDHRRLLKPLRR